MKILNIRDIHGPQRPTHESLHVAYDTAEKRGIQLANDGRAYAPFLRAAPVLPNGRNGRWQDGKVVPRKRA